MLPKSSRFFRRRSSQFVLLAQAVAER